MDNILLYLNRYNLLDDAEHRFKPKRSTLTNLFCAQKDYSSLIEAKQDVDMAFLVFGVINHKVFLA